ncbi:MAG: hypothetical protein ACYCQI_09980 [Gammaproteobacteria bacterium]
MLNSRTQPEYKTDLSRCSLEAFKTAIQEMKPEDALNAAVLAEIDAPEKLKFLVEVKKYSLENAQHLFSTLENKYSEVRGRRKNDSSLSWDARHEPDKQLLLYTKTWLQLFHYGLKRNADSYYDYRGNIFKYVFAYLTGRDCLSYDLINEFYKYCYQYEVLIEPWLIKLYHPKGLELFNDLSFNSSQIYAGKFAEAYIGLTTCLTTEYKVSKDKYTILKLTQPETQAILRTQLQNAIFAAASNSGEELVFFLTLKDLLHSPHVTKPSPLIDIYKRHLDEEIQFEYKPTSGWQIIHDLVQINSRLHSHISILDTETVSSLTKIRVATIIEKEERLPLTAREAKLFEISKLDKGGIISSLLRLDPVHAESPDIIRAKNAILAENCFLAERYKDAITYWKSLFKEKYALSSYFDVKEITKQLVIFAEKSRKDAIELLREQFAAELKLERPRLFSFHCVCRALHKIGGLDEKHEEQMLQFYRAFIDKAYSTAATSYREIVMEQLIHLIPHLSEKNKLLLNTVILYQFYAELNAAEPVLNQLKTMPILIEQGYFKQIDAKDLQPVLDKMLAAHQKHILYQPLAENIIINLHAMLEAATSELIKNKIKDTLIGCYTQYKDSNKEQKAIAISATLPDSKESIGAMRRLGQNAVNPDASIQAYLSAYRMGDTSAKLDAAIACEKTRPNDAISYYQEIIQEASEKPDENLLKKSIEKLIMFLSLGGGLGDIQREKIKNIILTVYNNLKNKSFNEKFPTLENNLYLLALENLVAIKPIQALD